MGSTRCFFMLWEFSVQHGVCLSSTSPSWVSSHFILDITRKRDSKAVSCAFMEVQCLVWRFICVRMRNTRFSSHLIPEVRTEVALKGRLFYIHWTSVFQWGVLSALV